jgi:hypothetical protein
MMTDEERSKSVIRSLLDDLQPVLDHARFMDRFIRDVIEERPETRKISAELRREYETMFNEEYKDDTYRLAELAVELLRVRKGDRT